MSYTIHRSYERGEADYGWLHARYSFSFAEYHDAKRMGFGLLRVLNNDIVEPSQGFPMHPHENMEIVTLVLRGALEHSDSQGVSEVIHSGQVQYMSAGSGIYHSERNPSESEPVELFQIWIYPRDRGGAPLYEKMTLNAEKLYDKWLSVLSVDGQDNSIKIRQDAFMYLRRLKPLQSTEFNKNKMENGVLLIVIEGDVMVHNEKLSSRDEISLIDENSFKIEALSDAYVIVFEVPMKR